MQTIKNLIVERVKKRLQENKSKRKVSEYDIAKGIFRYKISAINLIKNIIYIALGVLSAGFGLKGFILPNGFIDGGVTGISLLSSHVSGISFSIFIVLIEYSVYRNGVFSNWFEFCHKKYIGHYRIGFCRSLYRLSNYYR
jgi:hypothetical protein